MWQMDAVTDAMPGFISGRRWQTAQEQAALSDLYARPNLGSDLYQAAILELRKAARADPTALLRLVPSPQLGHLRCLLAGYRSQGHALSAVTLVGAIKYLNGAQVPMFASCAASTLLQYLDRLAASCAHPHKGSAGPLELLNALLSQPVEDTAKLQCTPVTYFPAHGAIGITCSSLDRCIKDMLYHYLCEAIELQHAVVCQDNVAVTVMLWGGSLIA